MKKGYSIRIFLPSGDPSGLRVLSRPNWTGTGLTFSRTGFQEASERHELTQPGVYVLVGDTEESSLPTAYIGEGESVLSRLKSHNGDKSKDFWTWAVVFTSTDNSLNKAFIQHLESRMVGLAQLTKRCNLTNGNIPKPPTLLESDYADMEHFLDNMLSVFPLVGLSIFEETKAKISSKSRDVFTLSGREKSNATAVQGASGFIVIKGSKAAIESTQGISPHLHTLRMDLVKQGILIEKDETYIFTQDYTFTSPSMAGCVVLGRNMNGRKEWKNKDGKSLNDLDAATVGCEAN